MSARARPGLPAEERVHACGVRHEHECRKCGRVVLCCSPECATLREAVCSGLCLSAPRRAYHEERPDFRHIHYPPHAVATEVFRVEEAELRPARPEAVSAEARGGEPVETRFKDDPEEAA